MQGISDNIAEKIDLFVQSKYPDFEHLKLSYNDKINVLFMHINKLENKEVKDENISGGE